MQWHVEVMGEFYECEETSIVYYDPANGDTHLLNEFAGHIVKLLSSEPMSTEQLVEQISPDIDPTELKDMAAQLPALLNELLSFDIITQR